MDDLFTTVKMLLLVVRLHVILRLKTMKSEKNDVVGDALVVAM